MSNILTENNNDLLNYGEIDINKSKVLIENMDEKEKEKYEFLIQMLPQYQDRVKRDKESYKEEFLKILKKFEEQFNIFLFNPSRKIKGFKELLMFFAHLSHLFKEETAFIPKGLCKIISENYLTIPHEVRLTIVDSLSIMCKSGILSLLEVIPLFFNLMRCQDKILRKRLTDYIISSLTKVNEKHKNVNINKNIQNFCEKLLEDSNKKLARKTLNIIVNLYQKKIWNDSRTINMLANIAVNAKDIKISSAACKFFLSEYDTEQGDSSDEEDLEELKNKYKLLGKGYSQKTKKRKAKLKQLMKSIERKEERNKKIKTNTNFLPIDQLNDPYTFAEKLFHLMSSFQSGNFSHKLIILRLLGRILGRHRLIINNFFNSMIPLIKAEQKDLNIILASIIEATHDQIPPIELESLIKKLFDFFISDVLPPQQITLGLHTLYGIMERCPYCINEEYFNICEELRNYKNKSVANAARAVCNLYKEHSDKKGIENGFGFGDAKNNDTIEGIELLKKLEKKPKEYKMEYEEILSDKQLKQLKALKIKYAAELIQHKKIKDEDVIKNLPKNNNKENNDNEENCNDNEEEMEELDDEDLEEIEDEEGEELEDDNSNNLEEKEEENSNNENEEEELEGLELEEIEDGEEESIELDDDELEQEEESEESFNKIQGFVNPEELNEYKRTRRERIDEIRNAQKEKFVLNKKRKRENTSKTNAEKLKFKPLAMVMPKKRLEQKKKQDKIESLNKKIRNLKQQVGRFKRGKMILKKKGGKTTKLKKK
jgi:protein SDA1